MIEKDKLLFNEITLDSGTLYEKGEWRNFPEIVHDEFNIKGFFGEYRWMSNFGKASVWLDMVAYSSAEIAYRAAKHSPQDRAFFLNCSSEDSITYNREKSLDFYTNNEWDMIKVDVMTFLLQQKYDPELNPSNARKLYETGDKYLEETNWWGDTFWGKDLKGEGLNTLGQILMDVRAQLSH